MYIKTHKSLFDESERGQSLTEATLLMPLFFLTIFLIIQTCHLGIAIVLVNYGASSAARLAVQQNGDVSNAQTQFNHLMIAGLKFLSLTPHKDNDVTPNITMDACAELPAYPFVGQFLDKSLTTGGGNLCGGTKTFGPVALSGPAPYHFIIHGQATARMNYDPHG